MNMRYENVLQRLKEERARLSMSQAQMSRFIRISQSFYSKIELGSRRLSFYELKYMCEVGIDIHYIFTGRRCNSIYKSIFAETSYNEMIGLLDILVSIINYYRRKSTQDKWKDIYGYTCNLPYLLKSDKNLFLALRQYLDMQQQKMAESLGVDIKKLRDFEKGKTNPDSEIIWKLYDLYRIPPAIVLKDAQGVGCEIGCLLEMMDEDAADNFFHIVTNTVPIWNISENEQEQLLVYLKRR